MKTEVAFQSAYLCFSVQVKDDASDAHRLKALQFVQRWIAMIVSDMEQGKQVPE